MPLRLDFPHLRLVEARAMMVAEIGAERTDISERLAEDGDIAVIGMRNPDYEAGDYAEAPSVVPASELLDATWDWDKNLLHMAFYGRDEDPTHFYGYKNVAFPRGEFVAWLKKIEGAAITPPQPRKSGRPSIYAAKTIEFLDELDVPRGTKGNSQLARELMQKFLDENLKPPAPDYAYDLVKKHRV